MKIGVILDTHLTAASRKLKGIVDLCFSDVELIIHVGDLVDLSALDVFGNREVKWRIRFKAAPYSGGRQHLIPD